MRRNELRRIMLTFRTIRMACATALCGALLAGCQAKLMPTPGRLRRQLVLVAPDMDLGVFENAIHDEMVGVPENMSIYFSTRDRALDFSAWIYGFARLGEPLTELSEKDMAFLRDHPDVSLIDVAGAEKKHGSWLGHSYFHNDPWVSSDVLMLMRHHVDPAGRGLIN